MECPSCGSLTHKLVFTKTGCHCTNCQAPSPDKPMVGVVVRGENRYKPQMSHADIMHIQTRKLGEDGVIRSAPRWETKDY